MPFWWLQDLLEAVKPVLEEEQLQDAADSLLMENDSYDAKIMYHAMKVGKKLLYVNVNWLNHELLNLDTNFSIYRGLFYCWRKL